jgi:tRNA nucleotidyltransferase (CCA-adding enzyme)
MKEALDVVMAWQLRNPDSTDAAAAIEAVKASREKQTDSELPSRLASHFLQLTIPPFFPQNKAAPNTYEATRQPAPWKEPGAQYVLELLGWSIGALSRKEREANWHLLVPPILRMIDDMDAVWKSKGCRLLGLLLESLCQPSSGNELSKAANKQDPANFLQRTGYHNVFADSLFPLFSYIPTLTPEPEAVPLFKEVLPTLTTLALLLPEESSKGSTRYGLLDKIMREGILAPLFHFPSPSAYPELASALTAHIQVLVGHMGIDSVKHLSNILPLLSTVLQEPFILSHKALTMSTLKALQAVMLNGWPRIPSYAPLIMMGLCLCWSRCMEDSSALPYVKEVKREIQDTVAMLDAVMQASEDASKWEDEKRELTKTSEAYQDFFDRCGPKA